MTVTALDKNYCYLLVKLTEFQNVAYVDTETIWEFMHFMMSSKNFANTITI